MFTFSVSYEQRAANDGVKSHFISKLSGRFVNNCLPPLPKKRTKLSLFWENLLDVPIIHDSRENGGGGMGCWFSLPITWPLHLTKGKASCALKPAVIWKSGQKYPPSAWQLTLCLCLGRIQKYSRMNFASTWQSFLCSKREVQPRGCG